MPLTGTKKPSSKTTPKTGRRLLTELLDQLDHEWATLKQDQPDLHGEDAALLAYYHACIRPALHWISGDPYTATFPEPYHPQRLPGMCRWLKGLQDQEGQPVKAAREQMATALRTCWPAYRDLILNDDQVPDGSSLLDLEILPFTWEAIETLWQGQNWEGDEPPTFLPQFQTKASEDFHLAALAVLFLNRQCRYYLTDLKPHQTHDGRG